MTERFDLCVIDGGTAGLAAAREAQRRDARVAFVSEEGTRGGNVHQARVHARENASEFHGGRATFVDPATIAIGDRRVAADRFVIATGSVQDAPPWPSSRDSHADASVRGCRHSARRGRIRRVREDDRRRRRSRPRRGVGRVAEDFAQA